MHDTNTVAIVRKCFSERSSPEIGFLRPHISHDHIVRALDCRPFFVRVQWRFFVQCMYYVKLPFAEDLRQFGFDNLDVIKRNQPSEEQLEAVDNLITTMDLTHADQG